MSDFLEEQLDNLATDDLSGDEPKHSHMLASFARARLYYARIMPPVFIAGFIAATLFAPFSSALTDVAVLVWLAIFADGTFALKLAICGPGHNPAAQAFKTLYTVAGAIGIGSGVAWLAAKVAQMVIIAPQFWGNNGKPTPAALHPDLRVQFAFIGFVVLWLLGVWLLSFRRSISKRVEFIDKIMM